jgi:predicted DNA-binding transcriptional regulator AlpA
MFRPDDAPTPALFLKALLAAHRLGMTLKAFEHMRARGDGPPATRFGARSIRFAVADIDRWAAARREAPTHSAVRPHESIRSNEVQS